MIKFIVSVLLNLATLILILLLAAGVFAAVIFFNPDLTQKTIEFTANKITKPYLAESVRIKNAHFDRAGKIRIEGLSASIQSAQGPVKFQVGLIESESSLFDYFRSSGLQIRFSGATFEKSKHTGIDGAVTLKGIEHWFVDASAQVIGLGFEDVTWINPDQLHGMTGNLIGRIDFHAEKNQEPLLDAELEVKSPGGVMQTQLIRYLFQYLPPVSIKPEVQKMVREQGLVPYSSAQIMTQMESSDRIKVFLFISIPDYNFNLNTNIEIRIDAKNAFGQIAQILGLIKAGHS